MEQDNSAPRIQVDDLEEEGESVEFGPAQIKELMVEAIRENPAIDPEALRAIIKEELAKLDLDPGLLQEAVMKQLHTVMHAQANNFAEHVANNLLDGLRQEYEAQKAAQKFNFWTKMGLAGVAVVGAAATGYFCYGRGRYLGTLERG